MQYRLNRAYTNTATLESRLSGGAGGRSLEPHEEGDAATLEGLGVGTVSYTHLTLPTICSV